MRARCFPDIFAVIVIAAVLQTTTAVSVSGATKTWDGRHDTSKINVTVVYFVPHDRPPLVDWKDRAS